MKDAYELLQQKETDLARVRHEIDSLRIVAPLLSDDLAFEESTNFEEPTKKPARSAEETLNSDPEKATGTEGLFSSINPARRSRFWNI
jgi:hypothetical protein